MKEIRFHFVSTNATQDTTHRILSVLLQIIVTMKSQATSVQPFFQCIRIL